MKNTVVCLCLLKVGYVFAPAPCLENVDPVCPSIILVTVSIAILLVLPVSFLGYRQIELRDMRYELLVALLTANDTESAARAEEGLDCVRKLLEKNYDLYAGRNGVPPIRSMDVKLVRGRSQG